MFDFLHDRYCAVCHTLDSVAPLDIIHIVSIIFQVEQVNLEPTSEIVLLSA